MKDILNKFFMFLGKAASSKGEPSSTRSIVMWISFIFSIALVVGYYVILAWYKDLVLLYAAILMGGIFTLLGVKAIEKVTAQSDGEKPLESNTSETKTSTETTTTNTSVAPGK